MLRLALFGVLAGLDDLEVATAISLAPLTRARRWLLIAAFALCEFASPLVGVMLASVLRTRFHATLDGIGPFVVVACGAAIVWLALRERDAAPFVNSRWTVIGLPLTLSFDNVAIGFSAVTLGHPPLLAAAIIGSISAALAVIGILAGARLARLIPQRAELVSGFALIAIAASIWIRRS